MALAPCSLNSLQLSFSAEDVILNPIVVSVHQCVAYSRRTGDATTV